MVEKYDFWVKPGVIGVGVLVADYEAMTAERDELQRKLDAVKKKAKCCGGCDGFSAGYDTAMAEIRAIVEGK